MLTLPKTGHHSPARACMSICRYTWLSPGFDPTVGPRMVSRISTLRIRIRMGTTELQQRRHRLEHRSVRRTSLSVESGRLSRMQHASRSTERRVPEMNLGSPTVNISSRAAAAVKICDGGCKNRRHLRTAVMVASSYPRQCETRDLNQTARMLVATAVPAFD